MKRNKYETGRRAALKMTLKIAEAVSAAIGEGSFQSAKFLAGFNAGLSEMRKVRSA